MADGSYAARLRTLRAADLFCGAGGTSTGAARAARSIGAKLQLTAVNHWPVALETHSAMHPDAEHICADLESVRPREVIPEGRLDLLMASPTCTFHSRARGGRPVHGARYRVYQQQQQPGHPAGRERAAAHHHHCARRRYGGGSTGAATRCARRQRWTQPRQSCTRSCTADAGADGFQRSRLRGGGGQ